jgi:hypothetical protein
VRDRETEDDRGRHDDATRGQVVGNRLAAGRGSAAVLAVVEPAGLDVVDVQDRARRTALTTSLVTADARAGASCSRDTRDRSQTRSGGACTLALLRAVVPHGRSIICTLRDGTALALRALVVRVELLQEGARTAAGSGPWREPADLATLGHMFGSVTTARAAAGPGVAAAWRRALAYPRALTARRQRPPRPDSPPRVRPVIVPGSLDDLKGPASGVVELPLTLFWSLPDRRFDLGDRSRAIDMYLAVLDAARGPGDLAAFLNGELLAELWPDLHLTRAKRGPWETRFEELRPAAAAA